MTKMRDMPKYGKPPQSCETDDQRAGNGKRHLPNLSQYHKPSDTIDDQKASQNCRDNEDDAGTQPYPSGRVSAEQTQTSPYALPAAISPVQQAFGFDTLDACSLAEDWRFERATPASCVPLDKAALQQTLAETTRTSRVAEGSWQI